MLQDSAADQELHAVIHLLGCIIALAREACRGRHPHESDLIDIFISIISNLPGYAVFQKTEIKAYIESPVLLSAQIRIRNVRN